jgi:hypothetical protein
MMMHEDWGTTQNYVVEDACRSVVFASTKAKGNARGWGEVRSREADFSTALLTIRL